MATGKLPNSRERRAEKLNERLRGAQRANVADESFHLDIPGLEALPPPEPSSSRRTPNTSAKRRRLDNEAPSTSSQVQEAEGSALRRSARSVPRDPYDLPDTSKESVVQGVSAVTDEKQNVAISAPDSVAQIVTARQAIVAPPAAPEPDDLESLPDPLNYRSPAQPRVSVASFEEVEESPAHAPGSGKRHVRISGAMSSSVRLHDALDAEADIPPSSSPLARKVRRSDATASVRSLRTSRARASRLADRDEVDELSPDRRVDQRPASEGGELSENDPADEPEVVDDEATESAETDEEPVAEHEATELEEAEEIDEVEAAKTLGRKRPRRSLQAGSPELGSAGVEEEEPAPKRRRGRPTRSPAAQRQSAPKSKAERRPGPQAKSKAVVKPKGAAKPRRESGEGDGPSIEITVQRFVNIKKQILDEADEDDPLQSEMAFANRGETVVDVFAQVCTEVIDATLGQFQDLLSNTDDKAKKKEFRIKMRAIEAYKEELNSRFLQHAIHLNDWQTLRKRVRHVQKEKLSLREEILRLKAEREQVALRMDAVRIKHEEDTKESTYRLNTSSIMHDVDLAIEQGRDTPELSRAEQKQAELANLEFLVSRISDEASSTSPTGGILNQVRDFNTFLERAAVALESR
ncbi:Fc.00g021880.m01.CDS01 [Cosmosporella sp. VM-42]